MSVESQDVYLNAGTTISAVGGGGGGPVPENLVVSTLSAFALSNISSINNVPYTGGGTVSANLVVSTLTANTGISSIGGMVVGGELKFTTGGATNIGMVSTIIGTSDGAGTAMSIIAPASVKFTTPSTIFTAVGAQPSEVNINGNLRVSTINNALPAVDPVKLPGYGFTIGSFSTTQGQFFPLDGSNRCFSMSTIAGHTYRLDLNTRITPTQPSVDPATIPPNNCFSVYIVGTTGTGTLYADAIPVTDVYNLSRGPLSSFNASYSIPFVAGGANASAYINYAVNNAVNFVYTNTTAISSVNTSLLTDLGVVA